LAVAAAAAPSSAADLEGLGPFLAAGVEPESENAVVRGSIVSAYPACMPAGELLGKDDEMWELRSAALMNT
jgi:hypothetical protein